MLKRFACWNSWLGRRMFLVVLIPLLVGFLWPLPESSIWNTIAVGLFAYMTFITALDTSLKDFLHTLEKPWLALWILLMVHGIMPLIAWVIGLIFYPEAPLIRLGLILGASVPIGVTSILWTSIAKGNVTLALVAVTVDTVISPILVPALIALVAGQSVHIDYAQMLLELSLMVTIPSILGMIVNDMTRGKLTEFAHSVGGVSSKLGIVMLILINASLMAPEIHWNLSLVKMLLIVLLIIIIGYYLGYVGSFVLKERRRDTIATMVYNVGMRNTSFGLVLALTYFAPAVAVPVTMIILYQQPLAAVISYLFDRYDRTSCGVLSRKTAH